MTDSAHKKTDQKLADMEKHLSDIYGRAQKEIEKKTADFWSAFEKKDEKQKKRLDAGEITEEQYKRWRQGELMTGKHWNEMTKTVSAEMLNADKTAAAYVNGKLPEIYSLNYNALADATSGIKGYSFELVDAATVRNLATSDKTLLPYKQVDGKKVERWNTQKVNSEVMQGIIQGESIPKIARRLGNVTEMEKNSAIRNARTTTTSAENKGRMDSYHTAEEMGIVLKKVWMSTHDGRTRPEHGELDGVEEDVNEPFVNGFGEIMYPGDPDAEPENVYNCRCTLVSDVKGFRGATSGKINYLPGKGLAAKHNIAEGKDISETWKRREDEYDFEIEDVINAQGFDGQPRIVSAEEFDKAVKEANDGNGFIAQRTYSAPDQETLDAYRNQLYYGDWYVDCSNGGAAYGKGMYSVYSNGTTITEYMEREIKGYANRRGIEHNYVETFTLTPNAKIITPNEITELKKTAYNNIMDEFNKRGGWKNPDAIKWASEHDVTNMDDGEFAAIMGYDAILTHGIDDYAIILNRTKLIIKEP